jgi:hypothetical protein
VTKRLCPYSNTVSSKAKRLNIGIGGVKMKLSEAKRRIGLMQDYGYVRFKQTFEKRWTAHERGRRFNTLRMITAHEVFTIVDLEKVLKYIEREAELSLIESVQEWRYKNPPMR